MNFADLQERCWIELGKPDLANRLDFHRQMIRDFIHEAYCEVGASAPYLFNLVRVSSFLTVAGQSVYALDDWCRVPMSFWTIDSAAQKLTFMAARAADRDNRKVAAATATPNLLSWYPHNTDAAKSGAAGSSTGATCVENGATVSKGASATPWTASDVGKMIRLNGEDGDYKILAVASAHSLTIDRPVKSRLTGIGTTGIGAGYVNVRWEISPPGCFRVEFLPAPSSITTIHYRGQWRPRRLIANDETPLLPDDFHDLLWMGAAYRMTRTHEDYKAYQAMAGDYQARIATLKKRDSGLMMDIETPAHYESMLNDDQGY